MPNYARKKDGNHNEITNGLRALGYYVMDLWRAGSGAPDALIGKPGDGIRKGFCIPIEIKKDGKAKLTPKEKTLRDNWDGPYEIVDSLADAVLKLKAYE